ncbi:MAG: hypothetical protein DWQ34_06465 [Planctomycetota bacterium]|nr:MAG: hypothetical protein DWQ29_19935 [Planctomycetota bacterium]REJ95341.1 MAG: hypothetical protein DWQ34_06465 [Planctomycetota bacterium]REK24215.1 MAG: hypothetical protein DWQ41_14355 [Planctomycetota bacterium]REK28797.1 MAG: hypothetical protein DWQ45_24160 [Planctomycetota bacterium]
MQRTRDLHPDGLDAAVGRLRPPTRHPAGWNDFLVCAAAAWNALFRTSCWLRELSYAAVQREAISRIPATAH